MDEYIRFSNGVVLKNSIIKQACEKALSAIERELPEEARFYIAYSHVINECKETLQKKKIVL